MRGSEGGPEQEVDPSVSLFMFLPLPAADEAVGAVDIMSVSDEVSVD